MHWHVSDRFDPRALPLADRHYNRRKVGSPQFVPPGRCLVLLTADANALWVTSWPFAEYVKHAWPGAWVCSLFRNESPVLSSTLIRDAVACTVAVLGAPPPRRFRYLRQCGEGPTEARPGPVLPPRRVALRRRDEGRTRGPCALGRGDATGRATPRRAARPLPRPVAPSRASSGSHMATHRTFDPDGNRGVR